MNKDEVVQMRIWAPEFKMPCRLDEDYSYIELTEYDRESDLKKIVESIDNKLSDWDDRPDLDNLKKRFEEYQNVLLVSYNIIKEKYLVGFGLVTSLTYDWIEKVKDLPTPNSNYSGGTYVRKEIAHSKKAGLQLYNYVYEKCE